MIRPQRGCGGPALLRSARKGAGGGEGGGKLLYLHRARSLQDLAVPPGNRLEMLKGNRRGRHSIRINDQWRLCFRRVGNGPHDVEIVDYR